MKVLNKKSLIAEIALLIFILPQEILADPSPGIKWLMDEPATLFDLGIRRIEKYVENKKIQYIDEVKAGRPISTAPLFLFSVQQSSSVCDEDFCRT
jgi:hypothetical protein